MARGSSGRIVLEIEPSVKKNLYDALDRERVTLKDWFLQQINRYFEEKNQLQLFKRETPAFNKSKKDSR